MHVARFVRDVVCAFAGLMLFCSCILCATPSIEIACGLDDQIMRHRFMPIQVTISGLAESIDGEIVVRQTRGTVDDSRFPTTHVVASGTIDNRTYKATIPCLEPLNPLVVKLVGSSGDVLCTHEQVLRSGICEWPFPLTINERLLLDEEGVLDSSEMPTDWWAYDAADRVWLMTDVESAPLLETLGEWVVSGGSLAMFTGAEFPRMDSPVFRKLLPILSPRLVRVHETHLLEGTLRPSSSIRIERNGTPLLITMPLGAGHVSLITLRREDLTDAEYATIQQQVPSAVRMPNIENVLHEALRATPVPRPPYWLAGALVVITLIALFVFTESRYCLERTRRLRAFVAIFIALGVVTVSATVAAWAYAGRHRDRVDVYQTDTVIHVQSAFGISTTLSTLFATERVAAHIEHPSTSHPLPATTLTIRNIDFSELSTENMSIFSLQKNERRDLTTLDQTRLDITMQITSEGIEISNQTGETLEDAYILHGTRSYHVPIVQQGARLYPLIKSYVPKERSAIPTALLSWFPMRNSIKPWLLLTDRNGEYVLTETDDRGTRKQVRRMAITIVEGELL